MSVELWKTLFDWATVVLIAFTVVSGAGALITGDIITKRLEAKLHQFGMDLEKQKGETAIAQAEVLRLQQQRLPRTLKFDSNESLQALIASLKHTPLRQRFYTRGAMEKRLGSRSKSGVCCYLLDGKYRMPLQYQRICQPTQ